MFKFSELEYVRPDVIEVISGIQEVTERFKKAENYAEARAAYVEKDELEKHFSTMVSLQRIRHDINMKDAFYAQESAYWNEQMPRIQQYNNAFTEATLQSPFRKELEEEFGAVPFINAEIATKCFSEEIIPEMQQQSKLVDDYQKIIAGAQIPFKGGVYTLSQLTPFKNSLDDTERKEAWIAEGKWYKEKQKDIDAIYDSLVHLRDTMAKKMGYENYIPMGYYRMKRNCYNEEDVKKFREAVVKYLVPVAEKVYQRQAERLGKSYPMSYADNQLQFRSGNPKPLGDADAIVAHAKKFYDELSPETSEFFRVMLEGELMDLLSREGKRSGGYCSGLKEFKVPFIFANFNGTQGDVEVVTHEAGHAFAAYTNRNRVPSESMLPSLEACEVHSMSMEMFSELWAEDFFGEDADKFRYSHLTGAITFIPYGVMVDHFQHEVYAHPKLTPKERHDLWKKLLGIYQPWMKLDGEIPFYAEGEGWQRQHHIFTAPFYYIDYCLAQSCALQFWALIAEDRENAWKHYMAYTSLGGSRVFTDLLKESGLKSPFAEETLKEICTKAEKFIDDFDLTGM